MAAISGDSPWAAAARSLYLVAMAIFLVTIGIGIPNALDIVTFDHNQLLTHVHSGTIGWLTLSIVATSFLAFRAADTRLALALGVLVPVYVAAFYTGSFAFRAITGVALLAAIAWLVAWVWRAYLGGSQTLPRLGLALALSTFALGAIIGVLLQVGFAAGTNIVPGNGIAAHAGAMTFGYLVLAGMAVQEWRVRRTVGVPMGGLVQMVALATGGLVITAAMLSGQGQVGGMLYLLAELLAVVLFAIRILPRALRIDWTAATEDRFLAGAAIWIVIGLGIFMYLVAQFVAAEGDESAINPGVLVASDHSVYIGVVTNTTFALFTTLVAAGAGSALARQAVFWGMNLGLTVFVAGLLTDTVILKQTGAPLMGVSLLLGLAVFAMGLLASRRDPAPDGLA
jgi:hypothetical protein